MDEAGDMGRLRQFGFTAGPAFVLAGSVFAWQGVGRAGAVLLTAGGTLLLLAGVLPAALRPLERCWTSPGRALGFVNTRVALAVAFLFVVTPIGILLRLSRRDPLALRPNPARASYFEPRRPGGSAGEGFLRQF